MFTIVIEADGNFSESQYLKQLQAQTVSADECHRAKQKTIEPIIAWINGWKLHDYNTDSQGVHHAAGLCK